jgi:hypothetical protein
MAYELVRAWRRREESDERWDLAVLGVTAGMRVFVELRDGIRHVGTVRQRSGGATWWLPDVRDGCIVIDPSGEALPVDDIVAIGVLPDPGYSHESEGAVDDDHVPRSDSH